MFGNDDDNSGQNDHQGSQATEPVADNALDSSEHENQSEATTDYQTHDSPTPDDQVSSLTPQTALTAPHLSNQVTPPKHTSHDDLLTIKQSALQQLKPLVGHLDQTPQEHFQTTMMMIQAADDQSLIGEAYEAAEGIIDDKARAQALLGVINEINYFNSKNNQ